MEEATVTVVWTQVSGVTTSRTVRVMRSRLHTTKPLFQADIERRAIEAVRSVLGRPKGAK